MSFLGGRVIRTELKASRCMFCMLWHVALRFCISLMFCGRPPPASMNVSFRYFSTSLSSGSDRKPFSRGLT
ncbi:hypothetical protein I7I48_10672 [Histoplasma ohiense]|nr:hypothetical protein I7I48_10672 [Histoplasma ohiense (nom. inval.)]